MSLSLNSVIVVQWGGKQPKKFLILRQIVTKKHEQLYDSFLWIGLKCIRAPKPVQGESLLFITESPGVPRYLFDHAQKDERLSQQWSHLVI